MWMMSPMKSTSQKTHRLYTRTVYCWSFELFFMSKHLLFRTRENKAHGSNRTAYCSAATVLSLLWPRFPCCWIKFCECPPIFGVIKNHPVKSHESDWTMERSLNFKSFKRGRGFGALKGQWVELSNEAESRRSSRQWRAGTFAPDAVIDGPRIRRRRAKHASKTRVFVSMMKYHPFAIREYESNKKKQKPVRFVV